MRVWVTGGAGFIGSHVVEALEREEHSVAIIDNFSTGSMLNLPNRRTVPVHTIRDLVSLEQQMEDFQPEVILHLAAQSAISVSEQSPQQDAEINIMGTLNLITAAKKYGVRRIVFASTSAVYHSVATRFGAHEYSETDPESPYGISKLTAEHYLKTLFGEVTILRLGNVYGPRQVSIGENQVVPRMINHMSQGSLFAIHGDGEQSRDYVYVEDVARAFVLAMHGKGFQVFNISSGKKTTVNELVQGLQALTGLIFNWEHDAADPRAAVLLHNYKARELLGWKPEISLQVGLKQTLDYWRQREHA